MQMRRSFVKISDSLNIWVYKGKFCQLVKDTKGTTSIYVYAKYKNGGPKHFLFSTTNYATLFYIISLLDDKFDFPVIESLHPDFKEVQL